MQFHIPSLLVPNTMLSKYTTNLHTEYLSSLISTRRFRHIDMSRHTARMRMRGDKLGHISVTVRWSIKFDKATQF